MGLVVISQKLTRNRECSCCKVRHISQQTTHSNSRAWWLTTRCDFERAIILLKLGSTCFLCPGVSLAWKKWNFEVPFNLSQFCLQECGHLAHSKFVTACFIYRYGKKQIAMIAPIWVLNALLSNPFSRLFLQTRQAPSIVKICQPIRNHPIPLCQPEKYVLFACNLQLCLFE